MRCQTCNGTGVYRPFQGFYAAKHPQRPCPDCICGVPHYGLTLADCDRKEDALQRLADLGQEYDANEVP